MHNLFSGVVAGRECLGILVSPTPQAVPQDSKVFGRFLHIKGGVASKHCTGTAIQPLARAVGLIVLTP